MNSLEFLFFLVFASSSILNIADTKGYPSLIASPPNTVTRSDRDSGSITVDANAPKIPPGTVVAPPAADRTSAATVSAPTAPDPTAPTLAPTAPDPTAPTLAPKAHVRTTPTLAPTAPTLAPKAHVRTTPTLAPTAPTLAPKAPDPTAPTLAPKAHVRTTPTLAPTAPATYKGRRKLRSGIVALMVSVSVAALVMLFGLGWYFLRRKARKTRKAILKENFGDECNSNLEALQFNLATIEAATNKFSCENRIGKGGFGEVYKGVLDGQEIAVKKLSKHSTQGAVEFKNEVLLIAKLQHRNLVALLGFCLEEQEKILIYEYVPNKSLDYFLFDSQRHRLLSWNERYKIISGIAQAILYLHEHSRLKIIHRDLKPSNVLLDNNMNPKISDFGMARIVAVDEEKGHTMRIVGTYGYMSPEYAMLGKFSEKSDVYSFGVMILEIVSGKRNSSSYDSDEVVGLLNYAWRKWKDQKPLEILDLNLKESHSEPEVIMCIQIGLLCVQENPNGRPTMAMVQSYLNNLSMDLPFPREPAFYIHGRTEPDMIAVNLGQSANNAILSINEMSISNSFPR